MSVQRRIGYSVLATFLAFLGMELGLRVFWEPTEPAATGTQMVLDESLIWRIPPGKSESFGATARIGSDGLRLPAVEGAVQAPTVLTLGDSSVFGHGVPDGETLHDQLQKRLARRHVESRVVCGGVPGYSTEQTLVLLSEVGWGYEPKVLVVANQFSDMNRDRYEDRVLMEQLSGSKRHSLFSRSRMYVGLQALGAKVRGVPQYVAVGWPTPSSEGVPRVPPGDYVRNLERILAESRSRGIGVVFLQLPERQATKNGDRPTYAVLMDYVGRAWGVPVVYGDEAFKESGFSLEELFLDEVHPTSRGHAVLAEAVAEVLLEQGFPERVELPLDEPQLEIPVFEGELPASRLGSIQESVLHQRHD